MNLDDRLAFIGLLCAAFGLGLIAGRLLESAIVGAGTCTAIIGFGLLIYALFLSKPEAS